MTPFTLPHLPAKARLYGVVAGMMLVGVASFAADATAPAKGNAGPPIPASDMAFAYHKNNARSFSQWYIQDNTPECKPFTKDSPRACHEQMLEMVTYMATQAMKEKDLGFAKTMHDCLPQEPEQHPECRPMAAYYRTLVRQYMALKTHCPNFMQDIMFPTAIFGRQENKRFEARYCPQNPCHGAALAVESTFDAYFYYRFSILPIERAHIVACLVKNAPACKDVLAAFEGISKDYDNLLSFEDRNFYGR